MSATGSFRGLAPAGDGRSLIAVSAAGTGTSSLIRGLTASAATGSPGRGRRAAMTRHVRVTAVMAALANAMAISKTGRWACRARPGWYATAQADDPVLAERRNVSASQRCGDPGQPATGNAPADQRDHPHPGPVACQDRYPRVTWPTHRQYSLARASDLRDMGRRLANADARQAGGRGRRSMARNTGRGMAASRARKAIRSPVRQGHAAADQHRGHRALPILRARGQAAARREDRRPQQRARSLPGQRRAARRRHAASLLAAGQGRAHAHGLRHGHKTWMAEDGIPEILAEQRLGHQVPGMRGLYAHASQQMREELTAALQARWDESLRQRAAIDPHSPVPCSTTCWHRSGPRPPVTPVQRHDRRAQRPALSSRVSPAGWTIPAGCVLRSHTGPCPENGRSQGSGRNLHPSGCSSTCSVTSSDQM